MPECNEQTIVKVMQLPEGKDWRWFPDLNLVVVSDRLDKAGQAAALADLQEKWRRSMLRMVA
jgi:hypothetical protein